MLGAAVDGAEVMKLPPSSQALFLKPEEPDCALERLSQFLGPAVALTSAPGPPKTFHSPYLSTGSIHTCSNHEH